MAVEQSMTRLTRENVGGLKNEGERLFAEACLQSGCILYHQIPVGNSLIDFLVINPRSSSAGKLVEVTLENRQVQRQKHIQNCNHRQIVNTTGLRKQRQINSMKESGHKWTILFSQEINNLRKKKLANS